MFKKKILALATCTLLFSACGGGGGDSTPSTTTPPASVSGDTALLTASNLCNTATNIILLENTRTLTSASATSVGKLFLNTDCSNYTNETVDSGVQVKSLITDKTVRLVYSKIDVSFNTATPSIIYVKNSSNTLAQVVYQANYIGKNFFISSDDIVYSATFPSNADDYNTEGAALEITKVN